jgi:hypothetical protein
MFNQDLKPHLSPEALGFKTAFVEPFSIQYERKQMPDFGALEYAYTGLAEPFYPALGTGIPFRRMPVEPYQPPQAYVLQGVTQVGLWLEAGAMYNQPLTDENGLPIEYVPAGGIPDAVSRNVPAQLPTDKSYLANTPFPDTRINWGQ